MPEPGPGGKMVRASFAAAGMGDACPAIASVVLGGASILGGR
jgi:ribose/xylose/arabinose/galactoside ABC-type transport system permease subunit